jgi:uncharacterized phage-associated protein
MERFSVFEIANWFLTKERMSHKKLQKLCYYAVAWGYALFDKAIANESVFEAWIHGPVSPVLFRKYRREAPWIELDPDAEYVNRFDAATQDLLESVWATYGDESANSLEILSHTEPPWIKARGAAPPYERSQTQIDPMDMKSYYRSIYIGDDLNV